MSRSRRSGLTLIEALIAVSLLGVLVVKVTAVVQSTSETTSEEVAALELDNRARRVLDRIAYSVIGAGRDALFPDPESPNFSTEVTFMISLGVDETGAVMWSDPERVGLSESGQQVLWQQNPGAPEERRVSWTNIVRSFLEGELPNGTDDNGNGLVDERGLTFTLEGEDKVTVRLTLERPGKDGPELYSVWTAVTLRN